MRLALVMLLVACGGKSKSVGNPPPPDYPPGGGGAPDGGGLGLTCKDTGDPLGSCEPKEGGDNITPPPTGNRPPDIVVDPNIEVVGAIPKDSIHRVVRDNFGPIRICYENVLLANPNTSGRVVAKFKVGLDGTVSDATATGVHPELETCVVETIRKFRFPRPDGGSAVEVTYPLTFKPG